MDFKDKAYSFYKKNKKKVMASSLVWLSLLWAASTFADSPSKVPVNIVTAISETQKIQAENFFTTLFNATVSYLTTFINITIWFFTRQDVLWALVLVTVWLFVFGVIKRKFFRKGF